MIDYEKLIVDRLQELINIGYNQIILYPFGERGKLAKSILNVCFGIDELMIVDNKLSEEYKSIQNMKALKNVDFENAIVLITSDRQDIHKELCDTLYEIAPKNRCYELFPSLVVKSEEKMMRAYERRAKVIDKVVTNELIENKMIYSPKNTNSKFFLPYVFVDLIQSTIFLSDDYFEVRNLSKVFRELQIGATVNFRGTFVDIGANIGNHTLFFVNELGVDKVIAFEPSIDNYWILKKNIEINGLDDRVVIYNLGISAKEGSATISNFDYDNYGGTGLKEYSEGKIRLVSLDSLKIDDISFIKIDVEGMELSVLAGAINSIRKFHPPIMVEVFWANLPEVKNMLGALGYKCLQLSDIDYYFY